ncbi:MAG: hypothetical protein V7643_5201, partial [Mycobacterium sp.]
MRGLKTIASLDAVATGHAFVQNLRRGHYATTGNCPFMIASGSRSPNSRTVYRRTNRSGPGRNTGGDQLTQQRHAVAELPAVVDYQHVARCCHFECLQEGIDAASMPGRTDTPGQAAARHHSTQERRSA